MGKIMKWIDTKKELPKLDRFYFITDGKNVALAKWSVGNMCWHFLWHSSVFDPSHMLEINLPLIRGEE